MLTLRNVHEALRALTQLIALDYDTKVSLDLWLPWEHRMNWFGWVRPSSAVARIMFSFPELKDQEVKGLEYKLIEWGLWEDAEFWESKLEHDETGFWHEVAVNNRNDCLRRLDVLYAH